MLKIPWRAGRRHQTAPKSMAAPPPAAAAHDQHDYHAVLRSLVGPHLFALLDRADKVAVRGASAQLRDEVDRCLSRVDCSRTIKTQQGTRRLLALLGRAVGLRSLTLRSLEAVHAAFSENGTHACGPRLEELAIKLTSGDADKMTQDQLASTCQKAALLLRELVVAGQCVGSFLITELIPLVACSRLTALDLSHHQGPLNFTPLSAMTSLRHLRLSDCPIRSVEPLSSLTQLTSLDITRTPVANLLPLACLSLLASLNISHTLASSLDPLVSLDQLTELRLSMCSRLLSLDPLPFLTQLKVLSLSSLPFSTLEAVTPLAHLEDLDLSGVIFVTSLRPLSPLSQLRKLALDSCAALASISPLSSLSCLLDLDLRHCRRLPSTALTPLRFCSALKQLDIRETSTLDLTPLASCQNLRRLYASHCRPELDLAPLQGLMPRLEVKRGTQRYEYLDARDL